MKCRSIGLALRVAGLLVLLVVLVALPRLAAADTLADLRTRGELRWGGDLQGGEPYVYEDPRDPSRIVGFEVDIAASLARRIGAPRARFVETQWSNLVPSLERGDVRHRPQRPRGHARSPRAPAPVAAVLRLSRGARRPEGRDASGRSTIFAASASRRSNQTYAYDLLQARPLETVALRGATGAVLRPAARTRRRRPSRSHHRRPVRLLARGDRVPAGRGRPRLVRRRDAPRRRDARSRHRRRDRRDGRRRRAAPHPRVAGRSGTPRRTRWPRPLPPMPRASQPVQQALDGHQLALFLKGAAVTAVVSLASFALAMPLGMLLVGRADRVGLGSRARSPPRTSRSCAARPCCCSSTSSTSASRPS